MTSEELPSAAGTVVVGSGMAGLTVAQAVRAEGAAEPLVLEAGPSVGGGHYRARFAPGRANRMWLSPGSDPRFWRPYRSANSAYTGIAGLRRCVGGRSLYWHGVVLPIEESVLTGGAWPREVADDLLRGWRGGPGLYERERRRLERWSGRSLRVAHGPHTRLGIDGFTFGTVPRAVRNTGHEGRWEAYSPLREAAVPRTVGGARVLGVEVAGGQVRGVRVEQAGAVREVATRRVVLCASTVENSRLVIQALAGTGALEAPELPGLVDKIAQGVVVSVRPERLPEPWRRLAAAGGMLVAPCAGRGAGNLFVHASMSGGGVAVFDFYVMSEQPGGKWGRVRCAPGGSWPWPTTVEAEYGPDDLEVVAEQRQVLTGLWEVLQRRFGLEPAVLDFDGADGDGELAKRLTKAADYTAPMPPHTYVFPLGSEQHEAGTLPLGDVLTPDGEVRGVRGLYVGGAATFPRTGAANPVLTILALARRLGAHLASTA